MSNNNLYKNAHLIVSVIRVLEHKHSGQPTIDEVCEEMSYSLEQGYLICRKLKEMDIINIVEGASGVRIFVNNYLNIEQIPIDKKESTLEEELGKFRNNKKEIEEKAVSIQAKHENRKKDLFDEIQRKFKKSVDSTENCEDNS
jgi:hypothetical protein